jgi:hypothetical protein
MILKRTVLILGAGASFDYGFPLGRTLITQICSQLSKRTTTRDLLIDCGIPEKSIVQFQAELSASNLPSIDAFLENRPEFERVGKVAIASILIPCEIETRLERREESYLWYEYLHSKLIQRKQEFARNKLSVITFNYDRSFEAAFFRAVQSAYGLNDVECKTYVEGVPIIHVYGKLGEPFWLFKKGRQYIPEISPQIVLETAKSIKVIHEGAHDSQEFQDAREEIQSAEVVCCLGFGYHTDSVSRLQLPHLLRGKKTFLSAFKFTKKEIDNIRLRLFPDGLGGKKVPPQFGEPNQDVLTFLRETAVLEQ